MPRVWAPFHPTGPSMTIAAKFGASTTSLLQWCKAPDAPLLSHKASQEAGGLPLRFWFLQGWDILRLVFAVWASGLAHSGEFTLASRFAGNQASASVRCVHQGRFVIPTGAARFFLSRRLLARRAA